MNNASHCSVSLNEDVKEQFIYVSPTNLLPTDYKASLFSLSVALHFSEKEHPKHAEITFCEIYLGFANGILHSSDECIS